MNRFLSLFCLTLCVLALAGGASAVEPKEWTWMVYLDADNNLEPDGLKDFLEMAKVGSDEKINIVVQIDRCDGYASTYGNWTDCRRYLIQKGMTPTAAPLENLGEVNMGSKTVFKDFVVWAMRNYPAKRYALILWNHGGGWRVQRRDTRIHKAICWDETNGDACLYMKDVQDAIRSAESTVNRKLDIVGFDACLMGMIEVATDMKDLAGYMIGSEEIEPGAGWPYDQILGPLAANPTMTPRDLASLVVDAYAAYYKTRDASTTQSAIDLSKISSLNGYIRSFVSAAQNWAGIKAARLATRTYSEADGYPHADLYHFMDSLKAKGVTSAAVLSAAEQVKAALRAAVVNTKNGSDRTNSNGLAIFFPKTKTDYNNADGAAYPNNDFSVATGWNGFLLKFFNPPSEPSTGPSVDGTGTATLSRKTPVPAGSTLRSVTLTFKAAQDLSGGQVVITVPAGWSAPVFEGTNGRIELKNGTGVTATATVSGMNIVVNATTLPAGKSFKIYYRSAKVPGTLGDYAIVVKTKGPGGTLKAIATQPVLTVGEGTTRTSTR